MKNFAENLNLGKRVLVKFEQNGVVQTIQNFELFDKNWFTIFDKALTPF